MDKINEPVGKTEDSVKDSIIDRYVNRKISAIITKGIAKTPITANQITIFNFFVGIVALFYFLKGGYYMFLTGALVYQLNTVMDHCDGDIARLKNISSKFGFWLDLITDAFIGSAVLTSIGYGCYAATNNSSFVVWGVLAGAGVLISSILVFFNILKKDDVQRSISIAGNYEKKASTLEKFVDNTLNKNLSFYILIAALVNQLDLLLICAAIGVQIHWILILIILCKKTCSKK